MVETSSGLLFPTKVFFHSPSSVGGREEGRRVAAYRRGSSNTVRGDYSCKDPQQPCRNLKKHEESPRDRLVVAVHPRGEARVGIRLNVLVYVGLSRKVRWIATDIFLPLGLVHTYVVNPYVHRERQMFEINGAEAFGHSQVDDNVLEPDAH